MRTRFRFFDGSAGRTRHRPDDDLAIVEPNRRGRAVGRQRRRDPRGHAPALVDGPVLAVQIGQPQLSAVGVDARVQPAQPPRGDLELAGLVATEHDRPGGDVEALGQVVDRQAELDGGHRQRGEQRARTIGRAPVAVGRGRGRERLGLLARAREPAARILGHRPLHEAIEVRRRAELLLAGVERGPVVVRLGGDRHPQRRDRGVHVLLQEIGQVAAVEGRVPAHQLVADHRERVAVGGRADVLGVAELLGAHVVRGPEHRAGRGRGLLRQPLGDAEVDDDRLPAVGSVAQQQVVGLEIAVQHALAVELVEAAPDPLDQPVDRPAVARADHRRGHQPVDELHRHPRAAVVVDVPGLDPDDPLEVHLEHQVGLAGEADRGLAALVDLGPQPLDHDQAPLEDVDAQVHVADRPLAEGADALVRALGHGADCSVRSRGLATK